MREKLDLQALKNSKVRKHRTIYNKAIRLLERGLGVKELSEEEILELISKYPTLKVRILIGGDISVVSKKDTWMIKNEGDWFTLYHKGIVIEKRRIKEQYHIQDIFYDLDYVFKSIVRHDDFTMGLISQSEEEEELEMAY